MSTVSIEQKNRTICEFLGWEFKEDPKFEYMAYFEGRQMWCDNLEGVNKVLREGFKYHEDWNKLMPVVKKILHEVNAVNTECGLREALVMCDIKATHEAVYQFITWYNQQTP